MHNINEICQTLDDHVTQMTTGTSPRGAACNDDMSLAMTLELKRHPERGGDLFSRLIQQSTIYGVTDELARRALEPITTAEVLSALKAVYASQGDCERIARASYLHGNGFYKLVLCSDAYAKVRLHFWSGEHAGEENIHNHRWRLASRVLLGELSSHIYEPDAHNDGSLALEARLYTKSLGQLGADGVACGRLPVRCVRAHTHAAGEAYSMDVHTLHRIVRPAGSAPTMTLMVQSAPVYTDNYMFSLDHIKAPDLTPQPLSVEELREVLQQIFVLLEVNPMRCGEAS
jgi:hypothetical protein